MNEKLCRLCFVGKPRPIDIFSAEGIEMNIVEAIRVHFADEVIKNDHLPKAICRGCWTKLKHFHEFYNAVNEARKSFLLEFMNNIESNCKKISFDSVDCDDDTPSVKLEPVADIVAAEIETSSLEGNRNDAERMDNSSINHFGVVDFSNDEFDTGDDGSEFDTMADGVDGATALNLSPEIARKIENTSPANPEKCGKFDHLVSSYVNMICDICEHPFKTLTEATSHYRRNHNRKYMNVKCCQRRICIPGEMRDHIQYHLNPVKFKCSECGENCISERNLKEHKRIHCGKRFECDICQKILRSKDGIYKHIVTKHMPVQPQHECEICKKSFSIKHRLKVHVKNVHERRNQQVCHICAKTSTTKQGMLEHLKKHDEVKEPGVKCEFCCKLFRNKTLARLHAKNMHEQQGIVHECPQCQKHLPTSFALRYHISYHHNFKLHKCDICDKAFKKAEALRYHMATHTGVDLYNCSFCTRTFKSSGNMYSHRKRMHPDEWSGAREAKLLNKEGVGYMSIK